MQVRSKKYAENAYPLVSGIKNQQDVPWIFNGKV